MQLDTQIRKQEREIHKVVFWVFDALQSGVYI
jgi:hypothetical protein